MRYRISRIGAALGVASVAFLVAACGGSGGNNSTTGTGGTGGGAGAFQAYVSCLNQHGVTIQLPSARPDAGARRSGEPRAFPSGVRPSGTPRAFPSGVRPSGFGGGFGAFQKPSGVDDATWQKAQSACASVRPSFAPGQRGNGAGDNGALRAYRDCLANHGVSASAEPGSLNTADPKIAAAEKACAVLRPTAAPTIWPTSES